MRHEKHREGRVGKNIFSDDCLKHLVLNCFKVFSIVLKCFFLFRCQTAHCFLCCFNINVCYSVCFLCLSLPMILNQDEHFIAVKNITNITRMVPYLHHAARIGAHNVGRALVAF